MNQNRVFIHQNIVTPPIILESRDCLHPEQSGVDLCVYYKDDVAKCEECSLLSTEKLPDAS